MGEGLHIGRKLLLDIAELGLPTSTEALDPISPQYLQDCISWSAIGARTTESQTHREMASGLSSAVGLKKKKMKKQTKKEKKKKKKKKKKGKKKKKKKKKK